MNYAPSTLPRKSEKIRAKLYTEGGMDVLNEIQELKNQLSHTKNVGFLFGAGTSKALGFSDIAKLTQSVEKSLNKNTSEHFLNIKKDLESKISEGKINIEDVLNQTRRIREITGEKQDKNYSNIDGVSAKTLDIEICNAIHKILSSEEKRANLQNTKKLMAWLNMQNRNFSKEIYTCNYDLIFEKSLEEIQVPYFDGFVGSYEPFFLPENVEQFVGNDDITKPWIRLWKIHGSLSWFWKKDENDGPDKIVRLGRIGDVEKEGNEVVIYPSKEKYDLSRKQPFLAYFDRLKTFLSEGELLFIVSGYSFSDQHINEVIFNSLRQNNRLHILVFAFSDDTIKKLYELLPDCFNIGAFGPKKGIIGSELIDWKSPDKKSTEDETTKLFWDKQKEEIILGDFNKLIEFIVKNSGKKGAIEQITNG